MMSDREKEVAKMIEEINHLADKLISDTYTFRYKVAKRMLFLASAGALFSFIAISLHAYLN
jgi:spore cortex formation protein SpoVR/YcgB (stage V sporulation)